jgi:hypothetical protein
MCAIFGDAHGTLSGARHIIAGAGHIVSNEFNAVFGSGNSVSGDGNLVGGIGHGMNSNDSDWNLVAGYSNSVLGAYNLVAGRDHDIPAGINYASTLGLEAKAKMLGQHAIATGKFTNEGDAQSSVLSLRRTTPDASPLELSLDGGGTNFLVTEDDTAYFYTVKVVAKDIADSTKTFMAELKFGFDRATGVASVRLHGVIKTIMHADNPAWDINVTADTTNGRPDIAVTGQAGTNIHWLARVEVEEVV